MYKIAYVEDALDLAALAIKYLEKEGYEVTHFKTGEEALKRLDEGFQLWILDIMLPGMVSGYDIIKKIREESDVPVIFTSARDQDIDKVMGLELGSDDYLAKPYSLRELVLRVNKIIARCYKDNNTKNNQIEYQGYVIDLDKRSVFMNGEQIILTSKEYDLLCFLLKNKNKALSREQIIATVWGEEYYGSDRVVDDLLRRLRSKLENINVETIYGFGYRLLW